MPSLMLESSRQKFDLDSVLKTGTGVQVLRGVTGLGLPPVAVNFREGAGDGAKYRRSRTLARDLDLPLYLRSHDRPGLQLLLSQFSLALAEPCTLSLIEDDGTYWSTEVVRVGGGDYVYGMDTVGEREIRMVVTFRAGDPYFTYSREVRKQIGGNLTQRGMLPRLGAMKVTSSQAIGSIELENQGDAKAYPIWEVTGPGHTFRAVSALGETIQWNGSLFPGQSLFVDTQRGTVVDNLGVNRYAELAPAPRFWTVPPGLSTAEASFLDTTPDSKVLCAFRPRKWMVI